MSEFKERINELKTILREQYNTHDALEMALGKYLQSGRRMQFGHKTFYCPNSNHSGKEATVVMGNYKGVPMCGCHSCREQCKNPIDVAQLYGNLDFIPAVVEMANFFGLISCSEASDLLDGKSISKIDKSKLPIKAEPTTYGQIYVEPKKANVAYTIIGNMNQSMGLPRLKPHHLKELIEKRNLSMEEIIKVGFFTLPEKFDWQVFKTQWFAAGYKLEDLKYVVGFYFDRKTNRWEFNLPNGDAYCIPTKNIDGLIVALQIRLCGANISNRYFWISSGKFANNEKSKIPQIWGNTSGTPFNIVFPEKLKNRSILITEGFYKAFWFAKTYGCISISVQGVNSIAGIEEVVEELRQRYAIKNIMIGYDADMATKPTVLKPAIRLGAKLLGISEQLEIELQTILANNATIDEKIVQKIDEFFKTSTKYSIYYTIWDMDLEKGIDDLILAGHKDAIRPMKINDFWLHSVNILKAMKQYVEQNELEDEVVPANVLQNLFKNLLLKYA